MSAVKYLEKEQTQIGGELVHAEVSITFTCGFKGRAPYAVVEYPNGVKYSADAATVAEFFDQCPDQHIVTTLMLLDQPYNRTTADEDRTQAIDELDLSDA